MNGQKISLFVNWLTDDCRQEWLVHSKAGESVETEKDGKVKDRPESGINGNNMV